MSLQIIVYIILCFISLECYADPWLLKSKKHELEINITSDHYASEYKTESKNIRDSYYGYFSKYHKKSLIMRSGISDKINIIYGVSLMKDPKYVMRRINKFKNFYDTTNNDRYFSPILTIGAQYSLYEDAKQIISYRLVGEFFHKSDNIKHSIEYGRKFTLMEKDFYFEMLVGSNNKLKENDINLLYEIGIGIKYSPKTRYEVKFCQEEDINPKESRNGDIKHYKKKKVIFTVYKKIYKNLVLENSLYASINNHNYPMNKGFKLGLKYNF